MVSRYGGVLSLFVKFSSSKRIRFVKFHGYYGEKKKIGKNLEDEKKMHEKNVEIMGKKALSDRIRMTHSHR